MKKLPPANGKKHLWKPGQSGNPAGRTKMPDWLADVKRLPKEIAAVLWSKWLSMEAGALKEQAENWSLSALELGICRAVLADINSGDLKNIEIGLSRIIGKLSDTPPEDRDDLGNLKPDELLQRVRSAISVLETTKAKDGTYKVEP